MDYIKAFLVGGAICVIAQLLIDYTKLTPAKILVRYVTFRDSTVLIHVSSSTTLSRQ